MNNYIVLDNINSGEFGKVQKIMNKYTDKILAVKIETKNTGLLNYEAKIYNYLTGLNIIPNIKSYKSDDVNNYLFMDLMDYSLKTYKDKNFSHDITYQKSCNNIIINLIKGLKSIHKRNIIHRDIKPENICFSNNILKLIDFGIAKFINNENDETKENNKKKINSIIGTPNFISLHVLNLNEPNKIDDLESLCYIYIYLILENKEFIEYAALNNLDKKDIDIIKHYIRNDNLKNIIEQHLIICRNNNFNNNVYEDLIKLYN